MDNGAMIAAAAYHHSVKREFTKWNELEVNPNWRVYEL
jgi:tRNA A37 threonylcarbamoyltransferase TsaD